MSACCSPSSFSGKTKSIFLSTASMSLSCLPWLLPVFHPHRWWAWCGSRSCWAGFLNMLYMNFLAFMPLPILFLFPVIPLLPLLTCQISFTVQGSGNIITPHGNLSCPLWEELRAPSSVFPLGHIPISVCHFLRCHLFLRGYSFLDHYIIL